MNREEIMHAGRTPCKLGGWQQVGVGPVHADSIVFWREFYSMMHSAGSDIAIHTMRRIRNMHAGYSNLFGGGGCAAMVPRLTCNCVRLRDRSATLRHTIQELRPSFS